MSNDPRRIAANVLEELYRQARFEIDTWQEPGGDEIQQARRELALIIWNDHIRLLGYFAYINHIPWPPKEPRALQLVVNNKKPHR